MHIKLGTSVETYLGTGLVVGRHSVDPSMDQNPPRSSYIYYVLMDDTEAVYRFTDREVREIK